MKCRGGEGGECHTLKPPPVISHPQFSLWKSVTHAVHKVAAIRSDLSGTVLSASETLATRQSQPINHQSVCSDNPGRTKDATQECISSQGQSKQGRTLPILLFELQSKQSFREVSVIRTHPFWVPTTEGTNNSRVSRGDSCDRYQDSPFPVT